MTGARPDEGEAGRPWDLPEPSLYLIALDRGTAKEHEAVQGVVMRMAEYWWHRFASVWIVGSRQDATAWRDALAYAIPEDESSVLVTKLPSDPDDRAWAFFGPNADEQLRWLRLHV